MCTYTPPRPPPPPTAGTLRHVADINKRHYARGAAVGGRISCARGARAPPPPLRRDVRKREGAALQVRGGCARSGMQLRFGNFGFCAELIDECFDGRMAVPLIVFCYDHLNNLKNMSNAQLRTSIKPQDPR